jgi:nucleoid-associated protein YgaU
MDDKTKTKGVFDQMINAVSSRDEKAALEALKKQMIEAEDRAEAAERKVVELQAALTKAQADNKAVLAKSQETSDEKLRKMQSELLAAKSQMSALEQRALAAEAKVKAFEAVKGRELQEAAALEAAKAQIIATHTLTADETLSHLSLKYYGHATEPYWRIIYEANKDVIGANPNKVRPGLEIKIPVLPEDMKK